MERTSRLCRAVLMIVGLSAMAGPAIAQRSSVSHKHVVVRQLHLDQSCTMNCSRKEAFIGAPHAVGDTLKLGIGARQVHGTPIDGVPVFPRKTMWVGPDEGDLVREYNQFVADNIDTYGRAMTAWQAGRGLATATHDIIQKVAHKGKLKRAIVNVVTFDNGNYFYNGVKIMPDDPTALPTVLYVRATPSAASQFLPAQWNWPNAGTVQYAIRNNFDFATSTGLTTVAVGSVYDEPFNYTGTAVNPDARLLCLLSRNNSGCGQPQQDIQQLIGSTDATFAIVDYYRVIKPSPVAHGGQFRPALNSRVTDRVVNFACTTDTTGTYTQNFRIRMQLDHVVDRYTVYPDGKWYFTQRFKEQRWPSEWVIPATSPITRTGELPNLASRFLHHRKAGVWTDQASSYPGNTIPLDATAVNNGAVCSCAAQAPYSQSLACSTLNAAWTGNFTRSYTFSTATCTWSYVDDTSPCITGGPPPPPPPSCTPPEFLQPDGMTCSCGPGNEVVGASCAQACIFPEVRQVDGTCRAPSTATYWLLLLGWPGVPDQVTGICDSGGTSYQSCRFDSGSLQCRVQSEGYVAEYNMGSGADGPEVISRLGLYGVPDSCTGGLVSFMQTPTQQFP